MNFTLVTEFDGHGWRAIGLLLGLVLCIGASSLQAGERIAASLDSNGRVVFTNESPGAQSVRGASESFPSRPFLNTQAHLDGLIEQAANQHKVDPELVRAIVRVESNFNPKAVSSKGARGLMQLIPGTARRFGVRDSFDPEANLDGGIRYLKYLLGLFDGDLRLSLAAYNAGENVVGRVRGVPAFPETRDYLRKIAQIYPFEQASRISSPGIAKFIDGKGVVHFSNTDIP